MVGDGVIGSISETEVNDEASVSPLKEDVNSDEVVDERDPIRELGSQWIQKAPIASGRAGRARNTHCWKVITIRMGWTLDNCHHGVALNKSCSRRRRGRSSSGLRNRRMDTPGRIQKKWP